MTRMDHRRLTFTKDAATLQTDFDVVARAGKRGESKSSDERRAFRNQGDSKSSSR